ncbi:GAF domain-containing protein [Afipia felis]|uniref:GAF domain-containing protein n=1 Tax=Afipia felis TaxID=1035 RepID=UPI0012F720F9|nr:GAF domain-containing protein [Afipia felis]
MSKPTADSPTDESYARRLSWVTSSPTRWRSFKRFAWRVFYHDLPRVFGAFSDTLSFLRTIARILLVTAVALTPYWVDWWTKGEVDAPKAGWMSLVVAGLLVAKHLFDVFGSDRQLRSHQRDLMEQCATRHQVINRELFEALPSKLSLPFPSRVQLCEKILACMLYIAKFHTLSSGGDYFQVSLLTFGNENCDSIKVIARAKANRATNIPIDSRETIAYYVAKSGTSFVVDDMKAQKHFAQTGLSQKTLKYRSILLIPIVHRNASTECCGVVTIDSSRPYEFTGPVGDVITAQLMPFTSVLALLVEKEAPCMRIGS